MKVEVKELRKEFGRTTAVDNVSFSFDSGHIFGFVGPNGAGKTTTMRIISTLDDPTDGDVLINGASVKEDPEYARHYVGYVPDSLPAHSDITVHEYLDFFARAYGLRGAARREAVESVEEFTNVTKILDKHLKALSKGMKQRVSLGRALIHDPDVLILDEPAAGLDPRARIELRELLNALSDRNKAILISSHILTELTEICNGVVIIEKGKILETGTIDSILKKTSSLHKIVIKTMENHEGLLRELLQAPYVSEARLFGEDLEVEIEAEDELSYKLLKHIIDKGFKVTEFKVAKADLEDVFMSVTQGEVQ